MNGSRNTQSPGALVAVAALGAASAALALYQWMELLVLQAGGSAVCNVSATVNCSAVWTSDFAHTLHGLTGLPVAGLGLVWGVVAFGLALYAIHAQLRGRDDLGPIAALRIWAVLGLLACISFATAIVAIGSLCLTCLATYALVTAFALVAFYAFPRGAFALTAGFRKALVLGAGLAAVSWALALYPGLSTPSGVPSAVPSASASADPAAWLERLSPPEKQALAEARAAWLNAPVLDSGRYPVRERHGLATAPVRVVDFTDVLCGHCKTLTASLTALKKSLPPDQLSVEARHFPLDGECNKAVPQVRGDGVRCLGARLQICMEGQPGYWALHEAIFAAQASLSRERLLALAAEQGLSGAAVEKCLASPETERRLQEDIAYAMQFNPRGTPLVVVNGRDTLPVVSFLYLLAATGGNASHPAFALLPPARGPANPDVSHAHPH